MSDNLLDTLTSQTKMFSEPMTKLNSLMMANAEKLAEFQMDNIKYYAEMAMGQWQKVGEVRDLEGLKTLGTSQTEFATDLGKKMSDDFKALGEIGVEFKDGITEIFKCVRDASASESAKTEEAKAEPEATPGKG